MGALQKAWRFLKAGEWWDDEQYRAEQEEKKYGENSAFSREARSRRRHPLDSVIQDWSNRRAGARREQRPSKLQSVPNLDWAHNYNHYKGLVQQAQERSCPTCQGPMGDLDGHQSGSCNNCVMRQGANPVPHSGGMPDGYKYNRENAALPPPTVPWLTNQQ